ncbi:ATP-binding protein [Pontibacter sp. Tf4]|uniref:ATP-binding protein n=1 Tax=Pontibacter sp. Tf4 TaxID=2761620 RepID=UPI001628B83F|nr:ATP-binding protein [Pontibacter sp. Tf4]MBB6611789.1 ATP-binding protein [Pontibacter sp. Tf4]
MANFKVDTRLASLLGENYRSTEHALKELVDNAWDAEASIVEITLPDPFNKADQPIIISDNGNGMTTKEVEEDYLKVARDRVLQKGSRTEKKNRLVKGRKGIGKFAGLVAANSMILETKKEGKLTKVSINRDELKKFTDLEVADLPLSFSDCNENENGTTITLYNLNQNLAFPDPEKLKQILFVEYSRENDFKLLVNGEPIEIESLTGEVFEESAHLPNAGFVRYRFIITDEKKSLKYPGLIIRVQGKVVGKPFYFGLEDSEEIPQKLLKRVYGEVIADELSEENVTANWNNIIENSLAYAEIKEFIATALDDRLKDKFKAIINLQKARIQKLINKKLRNLPEHRRKYAELALDGILRKLYTEKADRVEAIISLLLDGLEKDEYWTVLKSIEEASYSDIHLFADALSEFGIVDMIMISKQAQNRLRYIDYLEQIIADASTDEMTIHKAIETNLWLFGSHFTFLNSNQSLKRIIEEKVTQKYTGNRANKRPDLLLTQDITNRYLLLEFKRPSITINRDHESQAIKYRDDLRVYIHDKPIDIWVIGGKVDPKITSHNQNQNVKLISFTELISEARTQLIWLLNQLKR